MYGNIFGFLQKAYDYEPYERIGEKVERELSQLSIDRHSFQWNNKEDNKKIIPFYSIADTFIWTHDFNINTHLKTSQKLKKIGQYTNLTKFGRLFLAIRPAIRGFWYDFTLISSLCLSLCCFCISLRWFKCHAAIVFFLFTNKTMAVYVNIIDPKLRCNQNS